MVLSIPFNRCIFVNATDSEVYIIIDNEDTLLIRGTMSCILSGILGGIRVRDVKYHRIVRSTFLYNLEYDNIVYIHTCGDCVNLSSGDLIMLLSR